MKRFNIRVYGVLINSNKELLLSDEFRFGKSFTKFPGGGLEWGEGTKDALKREFLEEFQQDIEVGELFYVNDFFQQSAFQPEDQIISFYYLIQAINLTVTKKDTSPLATEGEALRWQAIDSLTQEMLTFPIDKKVAQQIIESVV